MDILIVGASTGGVAAALAASEVGAAVLLVEEGSWPGGQLTSQGVCTPDENNWIEGMGCTERYAAFRQKIRFWYTSTYSLSDTASLANFNPGSCWVSRLSFEPQVGVNVLTAMMQPFIDSSKLKVIYHARVLSCEMRDRSLESVEIETESGRFRVTARYTLDATDTGALLPLCGSEDVDWVVGAESREVTGEPDAPPSARKDWVQPFTFPFAIEWSPETISTNRISAPPFYAELKAKQNYHILHGAITGIFQGAMPWWAYRRILASSNFADARIPADVAMINTAGNDYYGGNIIGSLAKDDHSVQTTLQRAREASLGYLYWLQNECERETPAKDGSTKGYPEFRLRSDLFGTVDGCSPQPYIRESRRIVPVARILEQQIVVKDFSGATCRGERARASFMADSIGIGHYALDIHPNGHGEPNHYVPTQPFQIPLGALIPNHLECYLPACKNLGTTHLTNGAYRLHPIEWNVGESAGLLAAWCVKHGLTPREVLLNQNALRKFQLHLVRQGVPVYWFEDVMRDDPAFEAVQILAVMGVPMAHDNDLLFRANDEIPAVEWRAWLNSVQVNYFEFTGTRSQAARKLWAIICTDLEQS